MNDLRISDEQKRIYENAAEDGSPDRLRCVANDRAANVVKLCAGTPHRRVLDIGSEHGYTLQRLAELKFAAEIHAVEVTESAVARIRTRQIPGLTECCVFDGYHLPYDNHSFDLALLSHVVEHAQHPQALLIEAARVARHVFIEVPLHPTGRSLPTVVPTRHGHLNFFTSDSIRALAQSSHLEVAQQRASSASMATIRQQKGAKGLIDYTIKNVLLKIAPSLALKKFSYDGTMLCRSKAP